jgi:hypothetical protein
VPIVKGAWIRRAVDVAEGLGGIVVNPGLHAARFPVARDLPDAEEWPVGVISYKVCPFRAALQRLPQRLSLIIVIPPYWPPYIAPFGPMPIPDQKLSNVGGAKLPKVPASFSQTTSPVRKSSATQ